ncbi:50S ribosomal protein L20 [Candidatus Aerophobetes bacterium]|uniref:Large ribosomal subunit protein bL20 n=1 Tax=Aerophobetes bacterium TaxID=2030807 RepID=A0A7V0QRA7_UNCAE|nr:50S ribosomal protein L20 [Candidatus Aerophobetes bacterium]HDN84182.1 50S ribosomal protein L20 [Candidatus Aerophobetes bacterium]
MSRVKRGIIHTKRRKKVLRLAKGYRGGRSKLYTQAKEAVKKSLFHSYIGRRKKKRDFRRLWIARINAAVRREGISYSRFIRGLKEANINLNRKVLSELAISEPQEFSRLVEVAKKNVRE